MAYLKLHSLLQTVLCLSWEEVCFLLGRVGAPLWPGDSAYSGHPESFSQLVPIVRTLLDQHADPIVLQTHLPNLPITNGSPTFAQDLKVYCHTVEWQGFYQHQVGKFADIISEMILHLFLQGVESVFVEMINRPLTNIAVSALHHRRLYLDFFLLRLPVGVWLK